METKVRDKPAVELREEIVGVFKRGGREATVADLVAATGLPKARVDEALREVADEYGARLRVTESGELLYSFPRGFSSRYTGFRPRAKRLLRAAGKVLATFLKWAFKVWIMLMLVGYFVVFVAIALVALFASMAGSRDSDGKRSGDGGGGLFMAGRLLDMVIQLWFYSQLGKAPGERKAERKKPLHRAVFSFVFGDGDPNAGWDEVERRAVIAYLKTHKGVIGLQEFMIITGKSPGEAEAAITRYCREFEGSPEVTDEGVIYYRFESILRAKDKTSGSSALPPKKPWTPSSNPKKLDRWFRVFNVFNAAFGGYFLYNALTTVQNVDWGLTITNARGVVHEGIWGGFSYLYAVAAWLLSKVGVTDFSSAIGWGLGAVPLAFAVLFFLIPMLRKPGIAAHNARILKDNLRRPVYAAAYADPSGFDPRAVADTAGAEPAEADKAKERLGEELAAFTQADVSQGADGRFLYRFPALERERKGVASARAGIDASAYDLGKAVFDSEAPGDK